MCQAINNGRHSVDMFVYLHILDSSNKHGSQAICVDEYLHDSHDSRVYRGTDQLQISDGQHDNGKCATCHVFTVQSAVEN